MSRARLRRQIARRNAIINRDKAEYYSTVINEDSCDPKKIWQALQQVLNKGHEMTLPPNQSDKALDNQFASFSTQKIKRNILGIYHNRCTTHGFTPQPVTFP